MQKQRAGLVLAALAPALLLGLWQVQAKTPGAKPLPAVRRAEGDSTKLALDDKVRLAEKKRVAVINKVKPSVVAVMARDLRGSLTGNGSGVLIDEDGYAL